MTNGFDHRLDPDLAGPLAVLGDRQLPTRVEDTSAFRDQERRSTVRAPRDAAVTITDDRLPESGIVVRVYRPADASDGPLPAIYWIHGGAFFAGNVDLYDGYCSAMVQATNAVVVTVDYRKAPENPFPVPHDDCHEGLLWLHGNAERLGVDPTRVAIAGASAGGGLALGVALRVRDEDEPALAFLYLAYPATDDTTATPSMLEFVDLPVCDSRNAVVAWQAYLGPAYGTDTVSAYAAPTRERLFTGLPPTLIQAAELDVFRDENIALAAELYSAGIPTQLHVHPGAYHGFDLAVPDAPATWRWYQERDDALRRALHP